MKKIAMFLGHLEYFTTSGNILWAFCNFVVLWYIFHPLGISLGILYQETSGNPAAECRTYNLKFEYSPTLNTDDKADKKVHLTGLFQSQLVSALRTFATKEISKNCVSTTLEKFFPTRPPPLPPKRKYFCHGHRVMSRSFPAREY
jgi:hypothetical protein